MKKSKIIKKIGAVFIFVVVLGLGKILVDNNGAEVFVAQAKNEAIPENKFKNLLNKSQELTETTILYEGEENKIIEYGEVSMSMHYLHIISCTKSKDSITYELERDTDKTHWEDKATITIREIEKQSMETIQDMILDLHETYPTYYRAAVCHDINDDSGVTDYYDVRIDDFSYYTVFYGDTTYLIESNLNILDSEFLENTYKGEYIPIEDDYVVFNTEIFSGDFSAAYVKEEHRYYENKAEIIITQNKNNKKYFIEIVKENHVYTIYVKNEADETLISSTVQGSGFYELVQVADINMDGYVDIQLLENSGTMNNQYGLYVYNETLDDFEEIAYDGWLSYLQGKDGYVLNWMKGDAMSGTEEKLIWEGNTLVKESEEHYQADE